MVSPTVARPSRTCVRLLSRLRRPHLQLHGMPWLDIDTVFRLGCEDGGQERRSPERTQASERDATAVGYEEGERMKKEKEEWGEYEGERERERDREMLN